jgi:hypothetical protein
VKSGRTPWTVVDVRLDAPTRTRVDALTSAITLLGGEPKRSNARRAQAPRLPTPLSHRETASAPLLLPWAVPRVRAACPGDRGRCSWGRPKESRPRLTRASPPHGTPSNSLQRVGYSRSATRERA